MVTAEDHTIIGGLGGAVAEVLSEQNPTPLKRVGIADCFGESAPADELFEHFGFSTGNVVAVARELLASN